MLPGFSLSFFIVFLFFFVCVFFFVSMDLRGLIQINKNKERKKEDRIIT